MRNKRLVRNKKRGLISGVCQGLGEYFNLSPFIFRGVFLAPFLLWFSIGFLSLFSAGIYILLSSVLPDVEDIDANAIENVEYEVLKDDDEQ